MRHSPILFVALLGATSIAFAEVDPTMQSQDTEPTEAEMDALATPVDVMDAGETPEDAIRRLELPDTASDSGVEHSAFGLATANAAAAHGLATSSEARGDAGAEGRANSEDARDEHQRSR